MSAFFLAVRVSSFFLDLFAVGGGSSLSDYPLLLSDFCGGARILITNFLFFGGMFYSFVVVSREINCDFITLETAQYIAKSVVTSWSRVIRAGTTP